MELTIKEIKKVVDAALQEVLDLEQHTLEATDHYVVVAYKTGQPNIPNGNGYVISYGGILAELAYMVDTYGTISGEEQLIRMIQTILVKALDSMYSIAVPRQIIMGV